VDEEAIGDLLDVGDGDAGELAEAEPAGDTEGEQEPIAVAGQPGGACRTTGN